MNTRTHRGVRTPYQVIGPTLVIRLGGRRRALSSAPQGGGIRLASHILNHQVEATPKTGGNVPDPAHYLRTLASRLRIGRNTVGLMTAVPMTQLVTARAAAGKLWVECFATVGVTNAVRAGEWPSHGPDRNTTNRLGTINLIVITNASLSGAAMVGAVQVATEAKAGVLNDHAVPSSSGRFTATGTGTDAVVIACPVRGQGPAQPYSGTHTVIGALIGRAVTGCISRGLGKAKKWHDRAR